MDALQEATCASEWATLGPTSDGLSYRRIGAELERRQIPTAQGGKSWHAQTVANIGKRAAIS
jgi:hypothetical protein